MNQLPGLTTQALGRSLRRLPEVTSTNDYVKEHQEELAHLSVVMAERQTAGKGRLGRSWDFSPGQSLAMSILLRDTPPEALSLLPLVTAVGVREGLGALTGLSFQIKWSNDILFQGEKICGILCESRISAAGANAVAGIGVNLGQNKAELAALGLVYATSLFLATGKPFSAIETAAALCNALESAYFTFFEQGFAPLRDRYAAHCVTLGKEVRVIKNGEQVTGQALDIAPDGGLVCNIGGSVTVISAGEASVRGLLGYAD